MASSGLRWRWRLANGGVVEAILDIQTEVVSQGDRVLSEATRGTKPEGHVVLVSPVQVEHKSERPPIEAVVTFDPNAPICILRVGGHEVAPVAWPSRERPPPPKPAPSYGGYVVLAALALAAIGAAFWLRSFVGGRGGVAGKLSEMHRSNSGLFVVHYDEGLTLTPAVLPADASGVVLQDKAKTSVLVIAALKPPATRDPWELQQRLHGEAVANLPKGAGRFQETSRHEGKCLGEPGAIVIGSIVGGANAARVLSCTVSHDGAGYIALSMLAEPVTAADELRVQTVVDATELTRLGERTE